MRVPFDAAALVLCALFALPPAARAAEASQPDAPGASQPGSPEAGVSLAVASPASPPSATPSSDAGSSSPALPPAGVQKPGTLPAIRFPDLTKCSPARIAKVQGVLLTLAPSSGASSSAPSPASGVQQSQGEVVALIGVEAPKPLDPNTPPAERFLHNLVAGEQVWIQDHELGRRTDDLKHRLVYIFRVPDGLLVNAEVVRQGYAREQADSPYQFQEAMRAYEGQAKHARKGLWTEPTAKAGDPRSTDPKATPGKPATPVGVKPAIDTPGTDPANPTPPPADKDTLPGVPTGTTPVVAPGDNPAAPPAPTTPAPRTGVVYASKSGTKYHKQDCRFLGKTREPISLEEAKKRNLGPCGDCKPDKP